MSDKKKSRNRRHRSSSSSSSSSSSESKSKEFQNILPKVLPDQQSEIRIHFFFQKLYIGNLKEDEYLHFFKERAQKAVLQTLSLRALATFSRSVPSTTMSSQSTSQSAIASTTMPSKSIRGKSSSRPRISTNLSYQKPTRFCFRIKDMQSSKKQKNKSRKRRKS